jgi:hypothetical protein
VITTTVTETAAAKETTNIIRKFEGEREDGGEASVEDFRTDTPC